MTQDPLTPDDLTTRQTTPRPEPSAGSGEAAARDLAVKAGQLLGDFDCNDILVFDVRGASPITSYIVIASGTSDRQIKALGSRVTDLAEPLGFDRYGEDTDKTTRWVVLDFVDVMVHLFEPATRAEYDLEMLWGDAPRIAWQREGK